MTDMKNPTDKNPWEDVLKSPHVRCVSYDGVTNPSKLFRQVVRKVEPPLMSGGGVVLEGCLITAPTGTPFYCLHYHGDTLGWAAQIEQGAAELGLLTGKIQDDRLILSDGEVFLLNDCKIVFD